MFFFSARCGLAVCKTLGSTNTDFGENELFFTPKDECEDESCGFDRALNGYDGAGLCSIAPSRTVPRAPKSLLFYVYLAPTTKAERCYLTDEGLLESQL